MRCGCLLIALTIACLVSGFYGLHEAASYSHPTVLTYEQFVRLHPSEGWFVIKGCQIDVTDAIYEISRFESRSRVKPRQDDTADPSANSDEPPSSGAESAKSHGKSAAKASAKPAASPKPVTAGARHKDTNTAGGDAPADSAASGGEDEPAVSEPGTSASDSSARPMQDGEWLSKIWLPVHGVNSPEGERVSLVLSTMDPKIKGIMLEMLEMDKRGASEAEVKKWAELHLDDLVLERDLHGMVQAGLLASETDRTRIAEIDSSLNPDYMILDDGRKPMSMGAAIGLLFLGVLLALITAAAWFAEFLHLSRWFGWLFGARNRGPAAQPQYAAYGAAPPTLYAPYSAYPPYGPPSGGAPGTDQKPPASPPGPAKGSGEDGGFVV